MPAPERQPPVIASRKTKKTGIRLNKLAPIIILLVIATLILRDQFHQVDDFIGSLIHPERQAAIEQCREAALRQSESPDFARIIKWGKANATKNGYLIDHLVIGEMARGEGERRVSIICHVNKLGEIVQLNRQPYLAQPVTPPQLDYED